MAAIIVSTQAVVSEVKSSVRSNILLFFLVQRAGLPEE